MGGATDDLDRCKDIATHLVDGGGQIEEQKTVELQKWRPAGQVIGPYGPFPNRKGLGGNFDVENMLSRVAAPGQLPGGKVIADGTRAGYAQPNQHSRLTGRHPGQQPRQFAVAPLGPQQRAASGQNSQPEEGITAIQRHFIGYALPEFPPLDKTRARRQHGKFRQGEVLQCDEQCGERRHQDQPYARPAAHRIGMIDGSQD